MVMANRPEVRTAPAPVVAIDTLLLGQQMMAALARVPFRHPLRGNSNLLANLGTNVTREVLRSFMGYCSSLPIAELLIMFAARAVHLENLIAPQLAAGRWVLSDRFTDATYAYQGAGRGLAVSGIATLEALVQGARRPDLTILLDAPVAVALARVRQRHSAAGLDRFERERSEFFERVRAGYLARAAAEPHRIAVVDATGAAADVTAAVLAAVGALAADAAKPNDAAKPFDAAKPASTP